jgi:hypothetical protein
MGQARNKRDWTGFLSGLTAKSAKVPLLFGVAADRRVADSITSGVNLAALRVIVSLSVFEHWVSWN